MGLGNFGLGCQCCDDGGGDPRNCEFDCLEEQSMSDDIFIWQALTFHTIDMPQENWCLGETHRITVRGYSTTGLGFDLWPPAPFGLRFGGPGNFTGAIGFPFIQVGGRGGTVRITGSSHTIARVRNDSTAINPVTLPYTLPGIIGITESFAFDIPRVNYSNPFDWNVWLDVELLEHETVCGFGPTASFVGIKAGAWLRGESIINKLHYWGFNTYPQWNGGWRCICSPPPPPV